MGDFKWIQNKDTAQWILQEILPVLRTKCKRSDLALQLWIVGKHIPKSLKQLISDGVIFDENAPDKTSEVYKKADILLSPIRIGGGTSYKILEAMSSGVPVVTTPLGTVGLHVQVGKDVAVATTPEDLAQKVYRLLTSSKKYETMRKSARKVIEKNYSWTTIAKELEGVYKDALK